MARYRESETRAKVNSDNQDLLLKFFQLYNMARLDKTRISLHKKARIRAVKREKHVKKRVDAGLLEKVDLYKSKMNVITQEQAMRRAKVSLANNIEGLSGLLNRSVDEKEINSFIFDNLHVEKDMPGDTDDNFALDKLHQEKGKIVEKLKQIDYSFIPNITLDLSYKSIGEISRESQDIFEGIIGTPSYVYGASIKLLMPLTFEPEKVDRATARIQQNRNLYLIKGLKYELKYREKAQKRKLKIIRENIKAGLEKRRLSYKALAFQNNLYFHGRTELDMVLISERDIVVTEIGLAEFLARLEGNLAELAKIYAKLKEWLLDKKD
jgi:outer membrane protein TolC